MHPIAIGSIVILSLVALALSIAALVKATQAKQREAFIAPVSAYINEFGFANETYEPTPDFTVVHSEVERQNSSGIPFDDDPQLQQVAGGDSMINMIDQTSGFTHNLAKSNL